MSCGGGTQVRDVTCERTDLNVEVPEILCTDARPDDSNVCNDFECPQGTACIPFPSHQTRSHYVLKKVVLVQETLVMCAARGDRDG